MGAHTIVMRDIMYYLSQDSTSLPPPHVNSQIHVKTMTSNQRERNKTKNAAAGEAAQKAKEATMASIVQLVDDEAANPLRETRTRTNARRRKWHYGTTVESAAADASTVQ